MNHKWPSSWLLFWILVGTYAIAWGTGLAFADPRSSSGTEFLVKLAVRCALPYFLVAFTASSLVALWPNRLTRWLRANRRYFGLAFAACLGWHLIVVAFAFYRYHSVLSVRDLSQDAVGVLFLISLSLTSFRTVARRMSAVNWRRLHKAGVYVIWGVATHIYLGTLRNHGGLVDILFFSILLAALFLRIAAWTHLARSRTGNRSVHASR